MKIKNPILTPDMHKMPDSGNSTPFYDYCETRYPAISGNPDAWSIAP